MPWVGTTLIVPDGAPLAALVIEEGLTGMAEELVYRGVILCLFLAAWRARPNCIWRAVVAQGVLFGLAHVVVGDPVVVLSATVLGIAFGAAVVRIGSLWPLAIIHGAGNLGYRLLVDDGTPAAHAIAAGAAVGSVVVLYSWLVVRRASGSAADAAPSPGQ